MPKDEVLYDPEQHGKLHTPESARAYLREKHAVKLGIPRLADLRSQGAGPKFIKPTQREVRYPAAMLDEWAAERNRKPIVDFVPLKPQPPVTHAEALKTFQKHQVKRAAAAERTPPRPPTKSMKPAETTQRRPRLTSRRLPAPPALITGAAVKGGLK